MKNQNFEKLKKTPEDIIILQMCNTNENHMILSVTDRICHFGPFFVLSPLNNLKNQKVEKLKKKPGDISFYTSVP